MPTGDPGRRGLAMALAACAIVTALSLLWARQASYDPYAWLIWGREIVHGDLDTVAGPSWKPLPVLLTAPFAALSESAAPTLWVFAGRLGGTVSIVLAYRLARRIAGVPAGLVAAAALLLAEEYVLNVARGASEGWLVALVLAAFEAHLAGRRKVALALLVAAALVRPEVWPFLVAYAAAFLIARLRDRGDVPWGALAVLGLLGVAVLLAWFVPERIGSGSLLRGASRAQQPVGGSPAEAAFPFLAVFTKSASTLAIPVYAAAAFAVLVAWRDRARPEARVVLALAAVSTLLMLIVGVLAEAGFTGNPRYVTLPASLVCVLGGVGAAWAVTWLRGRSVRRPAAALACAAVLAAVAVPVVVQAVALGDDLSYVHSEGKLYDALPDVIAAAGGREAVLGCGGRIYTGPFQTQVLAWVLGLHESEVDIHPRPPGVVVTPDYRVEDDAGAGFPFALADAGGWAVRASCRPS